MKVVYTDNAPAAIGPYSQAVILNDMVFTSGQIPVIPATGEVAGDTIRPTVPSAEAHRIACYGFGLTIAIDARQMERVLMNIVRDRG